MATFVPALSLIATLMAMIYTDWRIDTLKKALAQHQHRFALDDIYFLGNLFGHSRRGGRSEILLIEATSKARVVLLEPNTVVYSWRPIGIPVAWILSSS